MNAEERFEGLAIADTSEIEEIADRILATGAEVEVRIGPRVQAMPIRLPIPGTQAGTFVVGQLPLTSCSVELGGARGDAAREGRDPLGAVAAAICDAEVERGGPLAGKVEEVALASLHLRKRREAIRAWIVDETRLEA